MSFAPGLTFPSSWGFSCAGTIPSELGLLTQLSKFRVDVNSLTGSIPTTLEGLRTEKFKEFYVASNRLCGNPVPSIDEDSSGDFEYEDNTGGCEGNGIGNGPSFSCDCPTPAPSTSPSVLPSSPFPSTPPTSSPTVTCTSGTFFNLQANECVNCAIGRYSNFTELPWPTSCDLCPAGFYINRVGADRCEACASGKLSSADGTYCKDCEAGEYSFNNTACVLCSPGTYAPRPQAEACLPCLAGSKTNLLLGSTTCSPCDAGTFSAGETNNCTLCPRGRYSPSGQEKCISCEVGTFASTEGSETCPRCSAGTYASVPNSTSCTDCELGKAQISVGQDYCLLCQAGSFSNEVGATSCSKCPAGRATNSTGTIECAVCLRGHYQSKTGEGLCLPCEAGSIASHNESLICSQCPQGFDSAQGSGSCNKAADKNFINPITGEAQECPRGALCNGGNELPRPRKGFWVDRSTLEYTDTVYACPTKSCLGADEGESQSSSRRRRLIQSTAAGSELSCWSVSHYTDTGPASECNSDALQCRKGSEGVLCGHCSEDFVYSSSAKICVECSVSWAYAGTLLSVGTGALFITFLLFTGRINLPRSVQQWWVVGVCRQFDSGTFRTLWSTYQVVQSVAWNLSVSFPAPFSNLIDFLSLFSFDFLSLECMWKDSDHFTSVLLWSIIPIILAAVNLLVCACRRVLLLMPRRDLAASTTYSSSWGVKFATLLLDELKGQSGVLPSDERGKVLTRQHTFWLLMLSYLVLPPTTRKQFQSLDCEAVTDGSYLRVDTSVSCTSTRFKSFAVADGLFIFIYLSIPLLWLLMLCRNRERLNPKSDTLEEALEIRNQDVELKPLAFLFESYHPSYYYWEGAGTLKMALGGGGLVAPCCFHFPASFLFSHSWTDV